MIAGLDAFNPCAFFVLLFLLSLLVHARSRARMPFIGGVFVLFSGLIYFLFMAAWLNLFLWLGELRLVTLGAGVLAVLVALVNVKDYFWFRRGPSLSIPDGAKPGLYQRMRGLLRADNLPALTLGTVALAIILGGEDFRPIIRRAMWLALASLAGGVAVLMLELGHPLRALATIPTSFAFTSPLYWKVICIVLYVLSLLVLLARTMHAGWSLAAVRGNAILSLVLALAVTAIAGVVYGSQSFRPFWASGDIPVGFIFESLLGGMAFIYFFSYLAYAFKASDMPQGLRRLFNDRLPSLFALVIFIQVLFVLARLTNGLYGNAEGLQVWQQLSGSPLFIAELVLGLLLPLFLLLNGGTRTQRPGPRSWPPSW